MKFSTPLLPRPWAVRCTALLVFALIAAAAPAHAGGNDHAGGNAHAARADAAPPAPTAAPADRPREPAALPGRLLVTHDPGTRARIADTVRPLGGSVGDLGEGITLVRVPAGRDAEAQALLGATSGVQAVEPDRVRPWARVPDDALFDQQWSHTLTSATRAWDTTVGSPAVRVALIDSGVRGNHAELRPNMVEQVDLSSGTPVARPLGSDNDSCEIGHGTQVAGILGAVGDNGMGVAGVAWRVGVVDLAVSATTTPGSCDGASDSAILAALHYATSHPDGPVDVVNLSVGGRQAFCPEAYERAVDEARREGVVVVAAAGNSGPETAQVPASCPGVIAVGAVDRGGRVAGYSATNAWVDLVAPGGDDPTDPASMLLTTSRRGDWIHVRGTSFAASYVSGVVALLRSVNAEITPDEVESVLERSADDDGLKRTDVQGWGRVNTARAISWVRRGADIPPPNPEPAFPVLRLQPRPDGPGPVRIGSAESSADSVLLAAQMSRAVFEPAGAVHAVVARSDQFADALAGSALGMGVGPLLFNPPGGELHPQVRKELRRALPVGARVYVLGGHRGLDEGVTEALAEMSYHVVRLSGATREQTAAAVAHEIADIRRRGGMARVSEVILATGDDWPDAVGAGALAARWAIPVLLTGSDALHPATREVLGELRPALVTVVGSARRVSDRVALQAQRSAHATGLLRLAGTNRHGTIAEVSKEALRRMGTAHVVVALNVVKPGAYRQVLSASMLTAAYGGVFLTLTGERGTALSEQTRLVLREVLQRRAEPADLLGVVVGGEDLVAPSAAEELEALLRQ